jgi:hypothetical protein
LTEYALTSSELASDELHGASTDDPWLTETAWYSFWDVANRFIGHVYMRFRPYSGIADCNIYVWDREVSAPWDAVYWKRFEMAYPATLADLNWIGGLRHRVIEPLARYSLEYHDDSSPQQRGFGIELVLEKTGSPRWFGRKHFDQPMRVLGSLTIDGVELTVDCRSMRDRSWYSRSDFGRFRSGYSYLLTDQFEVLLLSAAPKETNGLAPTLPIIGGYVHDADGEVSVVGGERAVSRRDSATGRPMGVRLVGELSSGKTIELEGSCRNSMAIACNAGMFSWMNFVEWHHQGATVFGEDQEIWSPSIWRAFRHPKIEPPNGRDGNSVVDSGLRNVK